MKYLKNKDAKIFFSGIGGVSMSAIAAALNQKGYKVCGSDIAEGDAVKNLRGMGIEIFIGHEKENIDENCGLLVYNARIKEDNPEIIRARELNIPVIKRTEMLGALMSSYKTSVGISGTHGKSSVTSMTSEIFMQAETDPTFFIGAVYPPINSAYKTGGGDYFILESCEYRDQFLDFRPNVAVILNIEMDHPDYFKDLNGVIDSFAKFLNNTSDAAIINADDENVNTAMNDFEYNRLSFSLKYPMSDIFVTNISYPDGFPEFDIIRNYGTVDDDDNLTAHSELYAHVKLKVPGEYNIYNAAAAAAVAHYCRIDGKYVESGLNAFGGAGRRFEYKGTLNGAKVYDDYAHHPTEVKNALLEMQKIADANSGKLWYIFQPHTYSRTHELFDDFCEALSLADNLILTGIYSATEKNTYDISSGDIAAKLENSVFIRDFEEIAKYLKDNVRQNDLVVVTGAGDINSLTKLLI